MPCLMRGNRNYTGSGGGGNNIVYGTTYPTETGAENDGDLYITLDENGTKKAMFLFEEDEWVLIDGIGPFDGRIYTNGKKYVDLTFYNAQEISGQTNYISITTGGGYINNYVMPTEPIDVTDYSRLEVNFKYGGTDYTIDDVDISSYTGDLYVMAHYYSGYGFNNFSVSLSAQPLVSTDPAGSIEIVRMASGVNDPIELYDLILYES